MKKRLISAAATGILCVSMAVPGMAATTGGAVPTSEGTEVYAGITLKDPDAKIRVTVPTLFAFVVNGVVSGPGSDAPVVSAVTDTTPGAEPTILLPNIKVKVDQASAGAANGKYHLETESSGNWTFVNYSTKAGSQVGGRDGLGVKVVGSIKNEGTDKSRNYWSHIRNADDAAYKGVTAGFKKYTLEINGEKFSVPEADGSFSMAHPIELEAPDLTAGGIDDTTKYAKMGKEIDAVFNVHVGGQRGQYNQVEESAKIGSIVWTIQTEVQDGAATAPDNNFLPTP